MAITAEMSRLSRECRLMIDGRRNAKAGVANFAHLTRPRGPFVFISSFCLVSYLAECALGVRSLSANEYHFIRAEGVGTTIGTTSNALAHIDRSRRVRRLLMNCRKLYC